MSGGPLPAALRARVDRTRCVGAGMCAGVAPEEFEVDGHGKSRPRRPVAPASADLVEAVSLCPMEAIAVFDAGSGRPVRLWGDERPVEGP
ncbi:hypothetical protein GCM10018793_49270 [Streptomyces sulfonofaciens]|uniref:Ferredoxin n=1 Tax=Streptomyces sulfonofaciens TaxID=68272 RepID=A0A919GIF3_9ACTN|nr:ferredoxin [Streptomyces sulfonofaciens]GHH84556.1 hypothetical protein GCM10018793_49270 [Streptomyces sulfonofaciens]